MYCMKARLPPHESAGASTLHNAIHEYILTEVYSDFLEIRKYK